MIIKGCLSSVLHKDIYLVGIHCLEFIPITNEPRCEKTGFFACAKTKTQISFAVTAKLISVFVFAT